MGENLRVDFHTHVVVDLPDFARRFGDQRWPTFDFHGEEGRLTRNGQVVRSVAPSAWLPQRRIEDMDAAGVDRQVLSPIPPLICDFGDLAPATEWATHLNGAIATLVANNPNRFSGLGTVPLHHPDRAIEVLQRAHDDGLVGVEIGTSAGGRELDDPDLREFFQAAEQLGMLIFVHPLALGLDAYSALRIAGGAVTFGLGMGTDTAIAASRLVFGGVVKDAPELKLCLAHGGGTFFWALARIAFMWDQQADTKAEELTRNVFVDSVVYQQANLRYLCERLGSDRILFGTDYPLPAQADMTGSILTGLPDGDIARIGGLNASSLLGLCPTCH
ncbi:amidohydrolase [Mycolicibacterium sp. CH28]|uniref:amidohydrolase family protein n=1 Tax=Mycolicibacterium sp. CH28 TaxID=2512237 RepID=UPI0010810C95|nr:amidohydrolase family protein [Mycolicibacterium sp. CH28]TGD85945.1 amidohydrolase [Mycolicibacterium sp. CH28]